MRLGVHVSIAGGIREAVVRAKRLSCTTMQIFSRSPRGGTAEPLVATSRAAAFGDIDNDGGVDVLIVNRDDRLHLLRNIAPRRGHWIAFRLLDEHGRDAYGASLSLSIGNRRVTRDVRAAYSYLASNDPRIHVGLGASDRAEAVVVRWVDGVTVTFGDFGADQIVTLRRSAGR